MLIPPATLRAPQSLSQRRRMKLVESLIPPGKRGGDKRTVIMREVVNGLMYSPVEVRWLPPTEQTQIIQCHAKVVTLRSSLSVEQIRQLRQYGRRSAFGRSNNDPNMLTEYRERLHQALKRDATELIVSDRRDFGCGMLVFRGSGLGQACVSSRAFNFIASTALTDSSSASSKPRSAKTLSSVVRGFRAIIISFHFDSHQNGLQP